MYSSASACIVVLSTAAGCSGASDGGAGADDPTAPVVVAPTTESVFVESTGADPVTTGTDVATTGTDAAPSSTPLIAPIPETGIPGIESEDAFCRSWSAFGGSVQALGIVSAIGDADNALRLEVIAANTIVGAVADMDASFPAELETERTVFFDEVTEPWRLRALTALSALSASGVVDLDSLDRAWTDRLVETGLGDPSMTVTTPAGVDADAVDTAVQRFAAEVPSIGGDPSLAIDAAFDETLDYLAENCPDGGILAGNDDVG